MVGSPGLPTPITLGLTTKNAVKIDFNGKVGTRREKAVIHLTEPIMIRKCSHVLDFRLRTVRDFKF